MSFRKRDYIVCLLVFVLGLGVLSALVFFVARIAQILAFPSEYVAKYVVAAGESVYSWEAMDLMVLVLVSGGLYLLRVFLWSGVWTFVAALVWLLVVLIGLVHYVPGFDMWPGGLHDVLHPSMMHPQGWRLLCVAGICYVLGQSHYNNSVFGHDNWQNNAAHYLQHVLEDFAKSVFMQVFVNKGSRVIVAVYDGLTVLRAQPALLSQIAWPESGEKLEEMLSDSWAGQDALLIASLWVVVYGSPRLSWTSNAIIVVTGLFFMLTPFPSARVAGFCTTALCLWVVEKSEPEYLKIAARQSSGTPWTITGGMMGMCRSHCAGSALMCQRMQLACPEASGTARWVVQTVFLLVDFLYLCTKQQSWSLEYKMRQQRVTGRRQLTAEGVTHLSTAQGCVEALDFYTKHGTDQMIAKNGLVIARMVVRDREKPYVSSTDTAQSTNGNEYHKQAIFYIKTVCMFCYTVALILALVNVDVWHWVKTQFLGVRCPVDPVASESASSFASSFAWARVQADAYMGWLY